MAASGKPAWPKTSDGSIDWEAVFEAPETGLIPRVVGSKTPAGLRKNTIAVMTKLYAKGSTPKYVSKFTKELDGILPDDLDADSMAKVASTIATIMRQIKDERITQAQDAAQPRKPSKKKSADDKNAPDDDDMAESRKNPESQKRIRLIALVSLGLLLFLGGGGVWWWSTDSIAPPSSRTVQLIEEMRAAARGEGPERHVFGYKLLTRVNAGYIGVTAEGVSAEACAGAAWVFVNRGTVVINDKMPERVSPQILTDFCSEKGQWAKLEWVQLLEDVE